MAQKSIVDRVLMLAAGICAAALVWQLTVLLTSKSRSTPPTAVVAQSAGPEPSESAPPMAATPAPAPAAPVVAAPAASAPTPAIRVVYAGTEPSTKTTLKASDPPVDAMEPAAPSPAAPQTMSEPAAQAVAVPGPAEQATASAAADTPPASGPAFATSAGGGADETVSTVPAAGAGASSRLATAEPPPLVEDEKPTGAPAGGAIDLNHASTEALNHLRGAGHIGQAIVSHRPYRSVEDLVRKRVLRRGVYEQIKQQVVAQ